MDSDEEVQALLTKARQAGQTRPNRFCAVETCPNRDVRNVGPTDLMHKFPTNPETLRKWIELLGCPQFSSYRNRFVCSRHFESDRFHTATCKILKSYNMKSCTRQCLMIPKGVLPTKNLPVQSSGYSVETCTRSAENNKSILKPMLTSVPIVKKLPLILAKQSPEPPTSNLIKVVHIQKNQPLQVILPQSTSPNPSTSKVLFLHHQTSATSNQLLVVNQPPAMVLQAPAPMQKDDDALIQPVCFPSQSQKPLSPDSKNSVFASAVQNEPVDTQKVPLSTYLLDEMAEGMESDPEANLKLVWSQNPSVTVAEDIGDVSNMCRFCAKVGLKMSPIFDSQGSTLAKKINECWSFQVQKSDNLPLMICLPCRRTLLRTHQFYNQCKEANSKLRELLVKKKKAMHEYITLKDGYGKRNCDFPLPNTRKQFVLPAFESEPIDFRDQNTEVPSHSKTPSVKANYFLQGRIHQPTPATTDNIQRTDVSRYPTVPAGTKTYSIYKFPDPKNLMKLPDYDCRHCEACYYAESGLCKHMFEMHSKFFCTNCEKEFTDRKEFELHQVQEHNIAPMLESFFFQDFGNKMCTFCDSEFLALKELRKHIFSGACTELSSMLKGEDPRRGRKKSYKCNFCSKVYYKKYIATVHMLSHLGCKDFVCAICDKSFHTKSKLNRHKLVHSDKLVAQCEKCGASFKHDKYLRQHLLTHKGRWNNKCSCCEATFQQTSDAEKHFKKHSQVEKELANNIPFTKVDPFECNFCGRHYKLRSYFDEHLKTHDLSSEKFKCSKQRNHLCNFCGKSFSVKANLKQHMIRIHEPSEHFECDICKRILKGKNSIALHVKSHLAPLVKCELCDMQLRGKTRVKLHMSRVHVEKRFCCEFCGKAFKMKKHLVVHIRVHTNERPFKCKYCDLAFKQWGDRTKHEALHLKNRY